MSHTGRVCLLGTRGRQSTVPLSLGEETALQRDDILLLCSDGVWKAFSASELAVYLAYESLDEGIEEMFIEAEERKREACDNMIEEGF